MTHKEDILDAFDGLDVKHRVQVILAAVESGLITADQALPAFAGLWEGSGDQNPKERP